LGPSAWDQSVMQSPNLSMQCFRDSPFGPGRALRVDGYRPTRNGSDACTRSTSSTRRSHVSRRAEVIHAQQLAAAFGEIGSAINGRLPFAVVIEPLRLFGCFWSTGRPSASLQKRAA